MRVLIYAISALFILGAIGTAQDAGAGGIAILLAIMGSSFAFHRWAGEKVDRGRVRSWPFELDCVAQIEVKARTEKEARAALEKAQRDGTGLGEKVKILGVDILEPATE